MYLYLYTYLDLTLNYFTQKCAQLLDKIAWFQTIVIVFNFPAQNFWNKKRILNNKFFLLKFW